MSKFRYKIKNIVHAMKEGEVDVIGHQANCQSTMKSGVAGILVKEWPEIAEADRRCFDTPEERLGRFSNVVLKDCLVEVFNLYGQYYYGTQQRQTNYGALAAALWRMTGNIPKNARVGFPKLDAKLAGGDWEVIEELIRWVFRNHDVTIYVLDYNEVPDWAKQEIE